MDSDILDVKEWVLYAQGDYAIAETVAKTVSDNPYAPNGVCYHCQQCAEKIFKAYLIAKEGIRSKEHDLNWLRKRCEVHDPGFGDLKIHCAALNEHITKTRYPTGQRLTTVDMDEALGYGREVLEFTRSKLNETIETESIPNYV